MIDLNKYNLLMNSIEIHQKLINTINENKNDDGISIISQNEISNKINRSQTWVSDAIRRLNREDICITYIDKSKYMVNYNDITKKGVFSKIINLIEEYEKNNNLINEKDKNIANNYKINLKTVQMFKTYVRIADIKNNNKISKKEIERQKLRNKYIKITKGVRDEKFT